MLRLLCGRKLGAAEINMNDLVFEYQHNRAVTAKEEDEIDTRPDEQMQNVQNKISLYFVGCILRYIRAGVYGILPKVMKMEIAECTETESNMKDLVSEYQQHQRTTKEKDCRVLHYHSPEEGVPATVHQPCQGRNNGIRRGREQHEPFCLRIPAVTVQHKNSLNFVEWISNRIKFGVRDIPPKCLKMAVAVLSRQLFSRVVSQRWMMKGECGALTLNNNRNSN